MVHSPHSSNTTLTMSWQPPAQPNGIIINYEVNVSTLSTKNYSNVSALNNHAVIQELGKFVSLLLKEMKDFIELIYSNSTLGTLFCECSCLHNDRQRTILPSCDKLYTARK